MKSELWIEEKYKDYYGMKYRVEKTLFSGVSDFQTVDIVETRGHGRMLLNDGLVMVTERDEFVYHDMMAHIPLFVHPDPKTVLVIGGGDGGTVREVLRHLNVEKCTMVEIDEMVVNACEEFIPLCSKDLRDPRVNLIIGDGLKYVEETKESYDIILVDSTDPIGPAQPLFGADFYKNINKCLNDNGIVVSQSETPWFEEEMQDKLLSILNEIFPILSIYNFHNLSYPGGLWSFSFASKGPHPVNNFNPERVIDSGLKFRYYTPEVHRASFALPQFMLDNIGKYLKG